MLDLFDYGKTNRVKKNNDFFHPPLVETQSMSLVISNLQAGKSCQCTLSQILT